MKKTEKLLVCTVFVALFIGIAVGAELAPMHHFLLIAGNEPHGYWTVEIRRADGTLVLQQQMPNLITDIGKKHARNLFSSLNSTIINADNRTVSLALSNDATPLASWTKLPNEVTGSGLDRKGPTEVTITILNATAYKTEYTWTASAAVTVQCTGVHWYSLDNSDNNLYAAGTFTQTTLGISDTIKITYTLNYG